MLNLLKLMIAFFLDRFNAREFATLIIDVLSDAKRRQTGISSPSGTPKDKGTL